MVHLILLWHQLIHVTHVILLNCIYCDSWFRCCDLFVFIKASGFTFLGWKMTRSVEEVDIFLLLLISEYQSFEFKTKAMKSNEQRFEKKTLNLLEFVCFVSFHRRANIQSAIAKWIHANFTFLKSHRRYFYYVLARANIYFSRKRRNSKKT